MALAGIWHGAGMQYLIFGLLHGLYITVNHAMRIFFPAPKKPPPRPPVVRALIHASKVLAVYVAALVAFAFFRAPSTGAALQMLAGMIGLHGVGVGLPLSTVGQLAILLAIVWFTPNTQQIMNQYEPALGRAIPNPYARLSWRPASAWALACGALAALGVLGLGGTTEFLYFQF
jgi:D-alanyl-lipoteichoic acid acyltransferase DltB (MBOAT superfamily)